MRNAYKDKVVLDGIDPSAAGHDFSLRGPNGPQDTTINV